MFELTSDAPTNKGKHVMSNIACAQNKQNTAFWLA